jgi:hypothetical protein
MKSKNSITTSLLSAEIVKDNQIAMDLVNSYSKVSEIITRTHIAMGKKSTFKLTNSSTNNPKLNVNIFAKTH